MNQNPSNERKLAHAAASAALTAENQRRNASTISFGVAIVTTLILGYGVWNALTNVGAAAQQLLVAGILLLVDILAVRSILINRDRLDVNAVLVMIYGVIVGGAAINIILAGLGLNLGLLIFGMAGAVAARALPSRYTNRLILLGTAGGGGAFVLDLAATWSRFQAPQPLITITFWLMVAVMAFFALLLLRAYAQFPMLTKLVLPFMLVSVVSVAALSSYNSAATHYALTESANQKLRAAALQTAAQIDAFYAAVSNSMLVESSQSGLVDYLRLPLDARPGSDQERAANALLRSMQSRGFIRSYTLMDTAGNIVLSTRVSTPERARALPRTLEIELADPTFIGRIMLQGTVRASPIVYDESNQPVLFFGVQIIGPTGLPVGVLVSEYSLARIQTEIVVQNNGLAGEGSFASIVDADGLRFANGLAPNDLHRLIYPKPVEETLALIASHRLPNLPYEQLITNYPDYFAALQQALESRLTAGTALQAGEETNALFFLSTETGSTDINAAAMVRAANFPWYVTYLQPQGILLAPVAEQTRLTTLLGIAVAAITVVASILIAQTLTRPIQRLTDTAEEIALGNYEARSDVKSEDEIGSLSRVFNDMTAQLQQTLQGLEARVEARTKELQVSSGEAEYRAAQLQTIAEIVRAIASERDMDKLLPLIAQTISHRFEYYHVGIFLLDHTEEFAVLRAANSEGGQRMLARSHRLRVGQEGIIGFVTSRGEPRVALDVGRDATFFNNPDLPKTRSEMGLPLRSGEKIIGALDVQSTKGSAFGEANIAILTILADQVSIAIENANLFSETRQALGELERIQRQYLRQQWQRQVTETNRAGYTYEYGQLRAQTPQPDAPAGPATNESALSASILLRGEQIGAIELFDPTTQRTWSEEERSLAQAVAEQVGLALENARLIEETQRRAERESLVAQITSRMRASNDPQVILQTAARELREALQASKAQILAPTQTGKPKLAEEE